MHHCSIWRKQNSGTVSDHQDVKHSIQVTTPRPFVTVWAILSSWCVTYLLVCNPLEIWSESSRVYSRRCLAGIVVGGRRLAEGHVSVPHAGLGPALRGATVAELGTTPGSIAQLTDPVLSNSHARSLSASRYWSVCCKGSLYTLFLDIFTNAFHQSWLITSNMYCLWTITWLGTSKRYSALSAQCPVL